MFLKVNDDGIRPAGLNDRCFYCDHLIGGHEQDCVLLQRTVTVRMSFDVVMVEPLDSDWPAIEFHRNDSSWCVNNAVVDLMEWIAKNNHPCLCDSVSFKVLRESSARDHRTLPVLAEEGIIERETSVN